LKIDRIGIARSKIVHEFGHLVVGLHHGFTPSAIELICPDPSRQVPGLEGRTAFEDVNDSTGPPVEGKSAELLCICVAGLVAEDLAKGETFDVAAVRNRFLHRYGASGDLDWATRIFGSTRQQTWETRAALVLTRLGPVQGQSGEGGHRHDPEFGENLLQRSERLRSTGPGADGYCSSGGERSSGLLRRAWSPP